MEYTTKDAVNIAIKCARKYKEKLLGKTHLFIYKDQNTNQLEYVEVTYYKRNFYHLTGLVWDRRDGRKGNANEFFNKIINGSISANEISFKNDGTTTLKLEVLPIALDITKITSMIADYGTNTKPMFYADKLIGGVKVCIGIDKNNNPSNPDEYVPASILFEDIRKIKSGNVNRVLLILEKDRNEEKYNVVKKVAKGVNINTLKFSDELRDMIATEIKENDIV